MTRILLLSATVMASLAALSLQAAAQPVTGIYIGAGGGANFLQTEHHGLNADRVPFGTGVVGVGSLGYGFGNGLRLEVEGDYRNNRFSKSAPGFVSQGGRETKYGGMVNAMFDLDVGSPYVFPYIGAGVGYSDTNQKYQSALLIGPGPNNRYVTTENASRGSFAYQAVAGLSFPIPPVVGLSLTAEYRYFALAGSRTYPYTVSTPTFAAGGRFATKDNFNHSLMIGLRYAFNVAPPPVDAPAPAPVVVNAARTYLVFFDWDRADLSDRARQIIAEAATQSTRVQVTRIEVSGHTDTTGTARYNQGLSVRRAQVVAAELVRRGVPQAAITTQGFGFSKPLVSTGPGVREPQNRRVEIILR